jgi:hypothetical protein
MGLLDRFKPQPRWKHVDPAIRLEAVRDLEDGIDLVALAESDPDAKVRRAAVAHLNDPACLARVAAGDADADVCERAADRLVAVALDAAGALPDGDGERAGEPDAVALAAVAAITDARRLSTVAKSEAPESVRTAALARVTDARALGSIARHAKIEATAAAALTRLTDSADLLEVALRSDHRDVALAAFDRLAASPLELGQLHSIEVRSQQKAVSRRARALIQDIEQAEALRHAAALERQRREGMLHDAVVQLTEVSGIEAARADLARLADAWAALRVTEPTSLDRFAAAVGAAEAAIARRQQAAEEAREVERMRMEAVATGETLCVRIETLEGDDCLEQLAPMEEEWRSLLPLVGGGAEAERLIARFVQAVAACRKRHEMSGALAAARARMDTLVGEAEAQVSRQDADAAAARWQALSREARDIAALFAEAGQPAPEPADPHAARLAEVDRVFAAREAARQAAADEARRAALTQVQRLVERTRRVADAETVTLREGDRLMRDIVTGIDVAHRAPSSTELDRATAELRALQETVAPRVHELRQLDEWRRFANAQRQEQLITMAEAIVGSIKAEEEAGPPSDPAATARALRELHAEWQMVAEAPRQSAQRLWDRFRLATDFIRARCEGYFQQLREQRHAGLEKKTAIVTEAESLSDSTDWAKTASRLQELQTEWQSAPRVGRDAERELGQRFRAACNAFFSRRREDLSDRKKVWSENLAQKEALCERAEALSTSSQWDSAASEMKRLQAEWKTIGPVRKSKSEVVWHRFRGAADRFFERYHNRHEIALAEKLADREAIVVELERLAAGGGTEQPDLAEQVQQVRATWHRSVPVPVPGMKELTDRWQVALSSVLAIRPDAFAGTDLDPAAVVQRMEKLVARAETVLADVDDAPVRPAASQTELLAAKLRSALASNAMGGRSTEESKWRGAGDAIRDAQSAWQRLPPVDGPEVRALDIRFRDACRRVHDQLRRHRQPSAPQPSSGRGEHQGGNQRQGSRRPESGRREGSRQDERGESQRPRHDRETATV